MDKKYLEHLTNAEKVYYVYNYSDKIFGLDYKTRYIVVVDEHYKIPKEFRKYKTRDKNLLFKLVINDVEFNIYSIQYWFKKIEQCHLEPWICACLNKKYVIKEYVKLLMKTEPLKLRLLYDDRVFSGTLDQYKYYCWIQLRNLKFINQIILNHKITNLSETSPEYFNILNSKESFEEVTEAYKVLSIQDESYLHNLTDGILLKYKQEKALKNA